MHNKQLHDKLQLMRQICKTSIFNFAYLLSNTSFQLDEPLPSDMMFSNL